MRSTALKMTAKLVVALAMMLEPFASSAAPVAISSENAVAVARASAQPIVITPESIRKIFLNGSTSVLTGLNGVYQAKESVNIARGNVLPSISVSAAISSVSSFGLSSVSCLLPFLLPSNWANLDQSRLQLAATGTAFYLAELNSYASAYALYLTILSDTETLDVLTRQAMIAEQIEQITQSQVEIGSASIGDLKLAGSITKSAQAAALHLKELTESEKSAFALMLSIPTRQLTFDRIHLAPNPLETASVDQIFNLTFVKSPEARQIESLIQASKAGEWSATFSFLGGYAVTAPTDAGGNTAFGKLGQSVHSLSGSIGFGYPATLRLSSLNTEALHIRLREIKNEELSAIRTVLASLPTAAQQVVLTEGAEHDALDALQEQIGKYKQGQITTTVVKEAANNVLTLSLARVAARLDLDNQRLNLTRILIADEFAKIPTCSFKLSASIFQQPESPLDWMTDLFSPHQTEVSVDQLCRAHEANATPRAPKTTSKRARK